MFPLWSGDLIVTRTRKLVLVMPAVTGSRSTELPSGLAGSPDNNAVDRRFCLPIGRCASMWLAKSPVTAGVGRKEMNELIEKLQNAPQGLDDYTEFLEDLLDGVDAPVDQAFFAAAFLFIENHSEADLGMPGQLVHFLEQSYPSYLDALCTSVERKPTAYTVWMMNRILNAQLEDSVRTRLLDVLRLAINHPDATPEVKQQATEFLANQKE